jgi:hypothetical protein
MRHIVSSQEGYTGEEKALTAQCTCPQNCAEYNEEAQCCDQEGS